MREPDLVAQAVGAMQDAVSIPVTVKHRIGVDHEDYYGFVCDFVGALFSVGCRVFIVHARGAILKGLSPKENREVPPLRPEVVVRLKQDFPEAVFVLNGGITTVGQAQEAVGVDGVMLGRAAYHDPWALRDLDCALFSSESAALRPAQRQDILPMLQQYFESELRRGTPAKHMTRHWHGLFHGQPGARHWRREICEGRMGPQELFDKLSFDFQGASRAQ
jgi:tRNA-dihydrouridine synthase A